MRKIVFVTSLVIGMLCSNAYAVKILEGEALFTGGGTVTGQTVYVDYIVSTHDLAAAIPAASFVFSDLASAPGFFKGDHAAYSGDMYYYYYQIERPTATPASSISALSLSLNPATVHTAGYIIGYDLDDAPFSHSTGDTNEEVSTIQDPSDAEFDDLSSPAGQTWAFSPKLTVGKESTVLFVSCMHPPEFFPASILDSGGFWEGSLPIPLMVVPEPASILLIGMSIVGVVLKKKRS
ncbi:PEP-CTERM sorting domain-containing protein [bacterium]|nr:PEP-CTERM sorting domain-containing protein [bacterium]MCP5462828.1 PEP-CTERM sorting domain-containing protein [bacterium]